MKIIRYNISKPKKYTGRDGQEKTQWNNIGTITEFHKDDGKVSRIIEIPAINLEANIFPFEPKSQGSRNPHAESSPEDASVGEIEARDIPF